MTYIIKERLAIRPETAESKREKQSEQDHAYHIIPIEELIPPALGRQLLGIAPGAPAKHDNEAKKNRESVTVNDYHNN
jgi:hypothetical protein